MQNNSLHPNYNKRSQFSKWQILERVQGIIWYLGRKVNLEHQMGLVLKHLNLQPLFQPDHLWFEEDQRLQASVLRVVKPQLGQPGHHLCQLGHLWS